MYNEFSTANIQNDKEFSAKLFGYGCVSHILETTISNSSVVRINQRFHENMCMRQSAMISIAISNIQKDLLSQPLQLLSGVDILGNASSALGHMSKGVAALSMGRSNPIKWDLLVIAGSMLYAISNVSEEFLVKSVDRVELMAMLGLFCAVVSACQISILERNELKSVHWSAGAVLPFIGFAAAMFLFYSSVPILLKLGCFFIWTHSYHLIRTTTVKYKELQAAEDVSKGTKQRFRC